MPSLRETQRAIWTSLVQRDDREAARHIVGDGLEPEERLSIYRNTFASTLAKALRLSFPAVQRLVGPEFFEGAAQTFAHDDPPMTAYLDEYGAGFPAFLARFPPAASLAYLPDVARLEWAVSRALHANDVGPLDARRLAGVAEDDRDRVCFVPHPSVSALQADFPVDAIWRTVLAHDDAALAEIDPASGPVYLIVQRLATGVDVLRTDKRAWCFAAALIAGRSLGAALDTLAEGDPSMLLAQHIAAGRFIGFKLADRTTQEAHGDEC